MARRGSALAAIACVGVAAAFVIQGHGWNQWAHYALIRAFDDGTTRIDRDNKLTGDKVYFHRHWYSARAPGLALASLPAYEALKTTEVARHLQSRVGDRNNSELLWLLGIWAATLPAVALMLLVRWVAEQVEPGFGTLAAVTLGLGTMVLPFSTLLFSHVLATCLGFAAFALLFRERHGVARRRPWPFALAGLLAGLAVISEYPVFIVAVVLGVYALSSGDRVRRGLAYVAGFAAGLVPLAVYNDRAFGSITHLSYAEVPRQQSGLFGIQFPRPIAAVEVLLSERGLLTLSPVLVLGAIGAVLIYRRGWRWEAGVVAAVAVGVLVYDSGYFLPFGGSSPGARFLIAMLPFLCFPLAATYRRWPGPTIALATASIVTLGIATVTRPLLDEGSDVALWARHLLNGDILPTAFTVLGVRHRWVALAPVLLVALLALAFAIRATPRLVIGWRAVAAGIGAAAAWAVFAIFGPHLLGIDGPTAKVLLADQAGARVGGHPDHPALDLVLISLAGCLVALLAVRLLSVARVRARSV